MSKELAFWVIYLISIFVVGLSFYETGQPLPFRRAGGSFILWVLIGIVGWAVFGAPIK